jgi:hypothetical protein
MRAKLETDLAEHRSGLKDIRSPDVAHQRLDNDLDASRLALATQGAVAVRATQARHHRNRRHDVLRCRFGHVRVLDLSGVPSADYVPLAVTGAGSAASRTVFMLYNRDRGETGNRAHASLMDVPSTT